jgi:hypothetical protein
MKYLLFLIVVALIRVFLTIVITELSYLIPISLLVPVAFALIWGTAYVLSQLVDISKL